MKDFLIILNSFLHDMATGAWISTLFMINFIKDEELTTRLQGKLFILAVVCFVIVIITGIIRGVTFRYYGWTGDVAKGRKRLLMVKHIVLGTVFLAGLYYQFNLLM